MCIHIYTAPGVHVYLTMKTRKKGRRDFLASLFFFDITSVLFFICSRYTDMGRYYTAAGLSVGTVLVYYPAASLSKEEILRDLRF
jgi:hypothetical protein